MRHTMSEVETPCKRVDMTWYCLGLLQKLYNLGSLRGHKHATFLDKVVHIHLCFEFDFILAKVAISGHQFSNKRLKRQCETRNTH